MRIYEKYLTVIVNGNPLPKSFPQIELVDGVEEAILENRAILKIPATKKGKTALINLTQFLQSFKWLSYSVYTNDG